MHNRPKSLCRRWHDKSNELSCAIDVMHDIDALYCELFAQMIYQVADKMIMHYRVNQSVRELGIERVSGLFKGQSRKRWYDKEPTLYQAIRKLYQLDEVHWHQMGRLLNIAIEATGEYASICHRQNKIINREHLEGLVDSVMRYGRRDLCIKFKEFGLWDSFCEQLLQKDMLFHFSQERPNPLIRQEITKLLSGSNVLPIPKNKETVSSTETTPNTVEKIQTKDLEMQVVSQDDG